MWSPGSSGWAAMQDEAINKTEPNIINNLYQADFKSSDSFAGDWTG
jgi:hypothetical protein